MVIFRSIDSMRIGSLLPITMQKVTFVSVLVGLSAGLTVHVYRF